MTEIGDFENQRDNLRHLGDAHVDLTVVLGSRRISLAAAESLTAGDVINLDKGPGGRFDVCLNDHKIGEGEIDVVGERFHARLTRMREIETP